MAPRRGPTVAYLVRHGQTDTTGVVLPGRAPGLHLSEPGRAQADVVATRLAALARKPVALYCSPLERTRETAAPIGRALGLRAVARRELTECDFGEWTGRKLAALSRRAEWTTVQRAPSGFRFPGGESFAEMQLRIWSALTALADAHRNRSFVVVSHADPIKAAVTYALGVPLDLFQRTVISPCSVSALALGQSGPVVLTVNSLGSLSDLHPS